MTTIYKYPVPIQDCFTLDLPEGAKALSVQTQNGEPQIWATVNPAAPKQARKFRVLGTGHPFPDVDACKYVGTFQIHGGSLAFHLFEVA